MTARFSITVIAVVIGTTMMVVHTVATTVMRIAVETVRKKEGENHENAEGNFIVLNCAHLGL